MVRQTVYRLGKFSKGANLPRWAHPVDEHTFSLCSCAECRESEICDVALSNF